MAKDKTRRPRAETPKGFSDLFGADVTAREAMLARIAAVYRAHGFDPLETSAVEKVEALGKFLPDVDRPNDGVFAWQEDGDADGDWLALRYDLTAPLARVYAQHRATLPTPYRRYAMGPVWRNEKPGPGRFRQFHQCDADTVGTPTVAADAEIIGMLCEALEAAGIARGDYIVRVNNRKVLNGVMEAAGLLDSNDPERFALERGIVLRAIDKLDRLGADGVLALLGEGRRDESGDFTKGAALSSEQTERILSFVGTSEAVDRKLIDAQALSQSMPPGIQRHIARARDAGDAFASRVLNLGQQAFETRNRMTIKYLEDLVEGSETGSRGVEELELIATLMEGQGYGPDRIRVDPSTVRGLGYYTGPVFEAELTFEVTGDDGKPRQFGSVAGGGRYDDLVKRFTGESVPATGVSIGVDRLLAALKATGRLAAEEEGPVVVTVMDRDRVGDAMALAAELRAAGIRAEAFLGNPKNFGAQMKYADRRRAPFAIIEGSDEKARGVVQVKDLVAGALAAETASLEEWKHRPAQVEVPRSEVAAHLRRLLSRQA